MTITPYILGSGRAGLAIAKSLAQLAVLHPDWQIAPATVLARGTPLSSIANRQQALLAIATPHGLHAPAILEAYELGFRAILVEKPACVSTAQSQALKNVEAKVALLHVYRESWGLKTLKALLEHKDFGELITLEGRYWQASMAIAAKEAESGKSPEKTSWKNDVALAGHFDTYLDIGSHWLDAASFLLGAAPLSLRGFRSYKNAPLDHRDSHVLIQAEFPHQKRALASLSKTVHGATNHFEMTAIGTRQSLQWNFLSTDEIRIGCGRELRVLTRSSSELGSWQAPFHGQGWLEGYIEIIRQLIKDAFFGETNSSYPRLKDSLAVMDAMLNTQWDL